MPTKVFVEKDKTQTLTNKTLDSSCPVYRTIDDPNAVARTIAAAAGDIPSIKDFGAVSGQDVSVALQKCIDWLPSEGGMIVAPPGIWKLSTKISPTKPLIILGCGDTTSRFIKTTASFSTLNHMFDTQHSLGLYNLSLETEADLDQNYQMHAARLDLDATGLTGRRMHAENVRCIGFNAGIYADGGAQYGCEFQTIKGVMVKNSGPASNYVGSAIHGNRVTNLRFDQINIDKNYTGEHGIYCFGSKHIAMDGIYVKNATRGESHSIKIVGDGVAGNSAYWQWAAKNIVSENCFHGLLLAVYGAETLQQLSLRDLTFNGITGSDNIYAPLAVYFTGTAKMDQVSIDTVRFRDHRNQCIHFSGGSGSRVEQVNVSNVLASGWSLEAAGQDPLLGKDGLMTIGTINIRMVEADGRSNGINYGRTVVNPNNLIGVEHVHFEDITEKNVTGPNGRNVTLTDGDTTPSVHIGLTHYVNNTGATNLTRLDDMEVNKTYTLYFANNFTTMKHGATLVLKSGADVVSASGMIKQFYTWDGVNAYEI